MKRTLMVCAALMLLVAIAACSRHEAVDTDGGTVRPATPPASTAADSDTVMTQTMEIGEERSQAEGGVLTDPNHVSTDTVGTTSTATSTAPSNTPPPTP